MKHRSTKTSLSHRFGLAMGIITLLAIVSIVAAIFVIQQAGSHAATLNVAGSLRMQSYRISTSLLSLQHQAETLQLLSRQYPAARQLKETVDGFTSRLGSEQFYDVRQDQESESGKSYQQIKFEWESRLLPLLKELQQLDPNSAKHKVRTGEYLDHVDEFVDNIDHFVNLLQTESEQRIKLLGLIALFCVFCTVGVANGVMYLLKATVLIPLRELVELANKFKRGHFSARVNNPSQDELGILAQTYNRMANSISRQYERLENAVAEKTGELTQSNLTLSFLYDTSKQLANSNSPDTVHSILEDLKKLTDARYLMLCYKPTVESEYYEWIDCGHSHKIDPEKVANDLNFHYTLKNSPGVFAPATAYQLSEGVHEFGFLYAEPQNHHCINPWQGQLMQNVADQLAASYNLQQQESQARLLILFEERAVIARELHDSLAQSLSYLKMQVSRLKTLLSREADETVILGVSNELQEGLNAAYRNLRELLNTFRLKIEHPSLQVALDTTANEFSEFSGVPIELNYNLLTAQLSPNEDIHVLQVVREAVSNAVKHAAASVININCNEQEDGTVTFDIVDDGIGVSQDATRKYHYGLSIMQERASSLNGEVDIQASDKGGTRVSLKFVPQASHTINTENSKS